MVLPSESVVAREIRNSWLMKRRELVPGKGAMRWVLLAWLLLLAIVAILSTFTFSSRRLRARDRHLGAARRSLRRPFRALIVLLLDPPSNVGATRNH